MWKIQLTVTRKYYFSMICKGRSLSQCSIFVDGNRTQIIIVGDDDGPFVTPTVLPLPHNPVTLRRHISVLSFFFLSTKQNIILSFVISSNKQHTQGSHIHMAYCSYSLQLCTNANSNFLKICWWPEGLWPVFRLGKMIKAMLLLRG